MSVNNFTVNDQAVNTESLPISEILDTISFNNFGLQNANVITSGESFGLRNTSNRDISIFNNPQADWEILNSAFFRGRNITVDGYLIAWSKTLLDDAIDNFKLNLSPKNKLLKWKVNGKVRQIFATMESIKFGEKDNIAIPYTLTFISQDSFWSNEIEQSSSIWNIAISPRTEQVDNLGQPAFPFIVLGFLTGLIGVTSVEITSDGVWIIISEIISDNDILVIDGRQKTVKLNDVEVDFDWIFPQLENGANTVVFTINGTFSVDVLMVYKLNLL